MHMLFALMMGGFVLLAGHVLLSDMAFAPMLQLSSSAQQTPTTLIAEPHPPLKVPVAVGVLSSGKSQERRMLWRSTLLPIVRQLTELQHGADYVLKFIVGRGLSEADEAAVAGESQDYEDIMRVDCGESRLNLTCKLIESCRAFVRDYDFRMLFRVDDDSFTRLDRLLPELIRRQNETALYEGCALLGQPIGREGSEPETKLPHNSQYMPYHSGSAVVLSRDLVEYVAHPPQDLKLVRLVADDAALGLWLAPFELKFTDRPDFNAWGGKEDCPVADSSPVVLHYFGLERWKDCAARIISTLSLQQHQPA